MEINIREEQKIVDVWLTNAEGKDIDLSGLYEKFGSRGYLVAVFRSGGEALAGLTASLLLYNRKKSAGC